MKYLALFLLLCSSVTAFAQNHNFGLGIILGEPTGVSSNYKLSSNNSIDAALAVDLDDDDLQFHSTYLFNYPNSLDLDGTLLGWYWGLGARVRIEDDGEDDSDLNLGPRASVGSNYQFPTAPVEIFAEAALIVNLINDIDADLDAGVGVRYYF